MASSSSSRSIRVCRETSHFVTFSTKSAPTAPSLFEPLACHGSLPSSFSAPTPLYVSPAAHAHEYGFFTRQQERHVAYHVPRGMGPVQCLLHRSNSLSIRGHTMSYLLSSLLTTEASIHFTNPSTSMSSTLSISSPLLKYHLTPAAK